MKWFVAIIFVEFIIHIAHMASDSPTGTKQSQVVLSYLVTKNIYMNRVLFALKVKAFSISFQHRTTHLYIQCLSRLLNCKQKVVARRY